MDAVDPGGRAQEHRPVMTPAQMQRAIELRMLRPWARSRVRIALITPFMVLAMGVLGAVCGLYRGVSRSGRLPLTFQSYAAIDWSARFDAILMNPPFTPMVTGYRMLADSMTHGDHVIALLPWLALINSQRRADALRRFGLVSVTHLPRSTFPGSRVQTCVFQLARGHDGATALHIL